MSGVTSGEGARIRFGRGDGWCEAVLNPDGTVTFRAGDGLRARLAATGDRLDKKALMYGASAFMGLSAVGATLVLKRKPAWGFLTLLLAALVAVFGSRVRTIARAGFDPFDVPLDRDRMTHAGILDGSLTFMIAHGSLSYSLSAPAGAYDAGEAAAFLTDWERSQG